MCMSSLTSHFWNMGTRNTVVKAWFEHCYALTQEQLQWETFRFRQWTGPALFFMHFLSLWQLGKLEGSVTIYMTRWVLLASEEGQYAWKTDSALITVTNSQSNPFTGQFAARLRLFCESLVSALVSETIYQQVTKTNSQVALDTLK